MRAANVAHGHLATANGGSLSIMDKIEIDPYVLQLMNTGASNSS